jgi:hypothetical protein
MGMQRLTEDLKVGTCGGGTCAQVADAKYQNSEQKVIFYPYTQSGLSFFFLTLKSSGRLWA